VFTEEHITSRCQGLEGAGDAHSRRGSSAIRPRHDTVAAACHRQIGWAKYLIAIKVSTICLSDHLK